MTSHRFLPIAAAVALAIAAGMPAPAKAADSVTVRVFAAASLTELVAQVAARFERARIVASLAGSSQLARQIEDGAPADVFLSASRDWVDHLRAAGALDGAPVVIARNRLVCIAPRGSALTAADPAGLVEGLAPGDRVAVADAGVPAGEYARSALAKHAALAALRSRLVGLKDVRAVLRAVERGEARAGFVYATDARVAPVKVLFTVGEAMHAPIEYWAAVVRGASEPDAARALVVFMQSAAGQVLLDRAGFGAAGPHGATGR